MLRAGVTKISSRAAVAFGASTAAEHVTERKKMVAHHHFTPIPREDIFAVGKKLFEREEPSDEGAVVSPIVSYACITLFLV